MEKQRVSTRDAKRSKRSRSPDVGPTLAGGAPYQKKIKRERKSVDQSKQPTIKADGQFLIAVLMPSPRHALYLWQAIESFWPDRLVTDCSARPQSYGCHSFERRAKVAGGHNLFKIQPGSWLADCKANTPSLSGDFLEFLTQHNWFADPEMLEFRTRFAQPRTIELLHLRFLALLGERLLAARGIPERLGPFWRSQYEILYEARVYSSNKYEFSHRCGNGPWCINPHHLVLESHDMNMSRDRCHDKFSRTEGELTYLRAPDLDIDLWRRHRPGQPLPTDGVWATCADASQRDAMGYLQCCPHGPVYCL